MRAENSLRTMFLTLCALVVIASLIPTSPASVIGSDQSSTNTNQSGPRIAVVEPIFSETAYDNAFYVFYSKYGSSNQSYIQSDLGYLNVTVKFGWGWSNQLIGFLTSEKAKQDGLVLGQTFIVIDEVNVSEGGLFHNGKRLFDTVVLGFTEYVTKEEYSAYKEFVATGGTLIIMDACNFLAEVRYYPPVAPGGSSYLSLVKGHGWEFNGTHAWKSVYHRWYDENKNWVGSNYWHWWAGRHYDYFHVNATNPIGEQLNRTVGIVVPTKYAAHEENLLMNFTYTQIIGCWHLIYPNEDPGCPIAAYEHRYVNGTVFHSGIMASDIIESDCCMQTFLIAAIGVIPATDNTPSLATGTIYALSAIGGVAVINLMFSICDMRVQKRSRRHMRRSRASRVRR